MTENEKKKIANSESFIDETFTKLPNFLVNNSEYAGISNDAKILYLLMRNAFEGSVKNGLKDEKGIYFYFTESKMSAQLHKSRYTCRGYKDELRRAHLIDYSDGDFDPKTGKRLPIKFYLLQIDYTIGDTLSHGKKLTTAKGKNENAENSDNSVNPKTNENSQAPQAYGDHHGKKIAMDKNEKANLESLDNTAPLKENENSQARDAYSDNHGKKLTMVRNEKAITENTDKSAFAKNENFNNVPSAQQNQPWSKINHNKDNKIDTIHNSSMLHNNSSYSTTPIVTNKGYKDSKENQKPNQNQAKRIANAVISGMTDYQIRNNKLSANDITLLAKWLNDVNETKAYVKHINAAINQGITNASEFGKKYYATNSERVLSAVSDLLFWDIKQIQHPYDVKHQIHNPNNYIFATVRDKVTKVLNDPNELNRVKQRHSNKRVEPCTDWSKISVDTDSSITTDQLRELFKDLDNK
ncbi:replication initiator protein A [Lactobacillus gallinarum]|uniref:replication initiator protein A n=1 Tax=Lactobacillus gallinarum TaxID=52242 RepID=UPI00389010F6